MKVDLQLEKKGYYVFNNFFNKKLLIKIKKEILTKLNNKKNYLPVKNVLFYKNNSEILRSPNGSLKKNLSQKILSRGLNYIKKNSNSISLKDPLVNIKNLYKIVYDKRFSDLCKKIFKKKKFFLGYIKVGVFFYNKLPKNCINFYHTDDLKNKNSNKRSCVKFSISLNQKKDTKSEFGIIPVNKNNLKINKQYFLKNEIPKKIKQKIIHPRISFGDMILFDPINYYHIANKPKEKRIIIYVEFLSDNKKIFNGVKINKKLYKKLDSHQKYISQKFLIT